MTSKICILLIVAFALLCNANYLNYTVLQTPPSGGVVKQDFAASFEMRYEHSNALYHKLLINAIKIRPEYDFHVSIERGNDIVCSGALLYGGEYVATAASCNVKNTDIVRLNAPYLREDGKKVVGINCVKTHPNFHKTAHHFEYDIALLKINETVRNLYGLYPNSPTYKPARAEVTHYSTLAGWKWKDSLIVTDVPVHSMEECQRNYGMHLTKNMLCAGDYSPNTPFCFEDRGSPLFYRGYLVGVKSFGEQCSRAIIPAVFTNAGVLREWMLNIMKSTTC